MRPEPKTNFDKFATAFMETWLLMLRYILAVGLILGVIEQICIYFEK